MVFKVNDKNWLEENDKSIQEIKNPKRRYSHGSNICDYIILHYTASLSASSAHNTYQDPNSQVGWHLTIDLDGSVYQLLDFRKRAWHAGRSNWIRSDGSETGGLNKWAIGIELINPGQLTYDGYVFKTWFNKVVQNEDVFIDIDGKAWYNYTEEQKNKLNEIIPALVEKYKCIDILGHEDISPGRKTDPGPAMYKTLEYLKKQYIK